VRYPRLHGKSRNGKRGSRIRHSAGVIGLPRASSLPAELGASSGESDMQRSLRNRHEGHLIGTRANCLSLRGVHARKPGGQHMPSTNPCQSPGSGAKVRSLSSVDRVPATYFIGATAQDVRLEAQLVSLGSRATEGQLLPAG
jgi:hypothetical protein